MTLPQINLHLEECNALVKLLYGGADEAMPAPMRTGRRR
jgi:hypothetical protein